MRLTEAGIVLITLVMAGLIWWAVVPKTPANVMSVTHGSQTTPCTIWRC